MANTVIQIRRSTTTSAPTSLQTGELAFTSNGDTLWIGSPSGSNTANVVHIGAKISYVGNSTQIGATSTGSNSELASTYAIKQFVDGKFTAYSTTLAGLTDVNVTGVANNNFLIYNQISNKWEDHTVSGTTNQITATFVSNDLTLSLPAAVSVNTSIAAGNSTVNTSISGTAVTSNATFATGNTTHYGFANVTSTLQVAALSTLANVNITGTANVSTGINVGANVNLTTSGISIGNTTVNTSISATAITSNATLAIGNTAVAGTITSSGLANVASANVIGGLVVGGISTLQNTSVTGLLTVTGNLTVTGTLTTIDAVNLQVEDSLIRLARNQANTGTFTDTADIGFYGVYGNTSSTLFTGLARDATSNAFILFANKAVSPDNAGVATSDTLSTLYAYLNSGGFVSNTTAVNITANSTVSSTITANTLSLSTALGVASGGTGRSSLTTSAVLVGNSTGPVSLVSSSTEGQVLQINSSGAPIFAGLDGGSF